MKKALMCYFNISTSKFFQMLSTLYSTFKTDYFLLESYRTITTNEVNFFFEKQLFKHV